MLLFSTHRVAAVWESPAGKGRGGEEEEEEGKEKEEGDEEEQEDRERRTSTAILGMLEGKHRASSCVTALPKGWFVEGSSPTQTSQRCGGVGGTPVGTCSSPVLCPAGLLFHPARQEEAEERPPGARRGREGVWRWGMKQSKPASMEIKLIRTPGRGEGGKAIIEQGSDKYLCGGLFISGLAPVGMLRWWGWAEGEGGSTGVGWGGSASPEGRGSSRQLLLGLGTASSSVRGRICSEAGFVQRENLFRHMWVPSSLHFLHLS